MNNKSIGLAVSIFTGLIATSPPPSAAAQAGGAPAAQQTVGKTFKNVQVLTDLRDSSTTVFFNTMQFIAGSLSVTCNYCHVSQQGPFDSDAKKTKRTARDMIRMVRAINEANFGGDAVVTCNTCHQGSPRPKATPVPWYKTSEQLASLSKSVLAPPDTASGRAEPAPVLPDVEQVMALYRKAVGGTRVTSIHMVGTTDGLRGFRPREMDIVFPDKVIIATTAQGGIRQMVNGDRGWVVTPQGRTAMQPQVIAAIKDYAALFVPVKYDQPSATRRVIAIETIGDRSYDVVESNVNGTTQRLFFDVQTGLLYKLQTRVPTVLGTRVEETTYEDYRDVGGVKLPCLITNHYMEDELVFRISEIEVNVPVDPAKFEPPLSE